MNNYCLYHANCNDGFMAAWAVWRKFGWGGIGEGVWNYIPVRYQEPVPEEIINSNGIDKIFIVDFSYSKNVLMELEKYCKGLVIIDHHKTAPLDYSGIIFDEKHSGCVLTWKYLFGSEEPEILRYVEDRDLWVWGLKESREINLGLEMIKKYDDSGVPNFEIIEGLEIKELKEKGITILGYKKKLIDEICTHAWVSKDKILGYENVVCCENAAGSLISEVGEELRSRFPEAPFILLYGINDKQLIVSLRGGKGEIDCGLLCKEMGGGGHPQAAGMKKNLNNNELINLINGKS